MTRVVATAGTLVVVAIAAQLALVEVFWLPLRVGGVLVPVSVAAAVAGNLLLVPLAHRVSGSRAVAVLPALVWLAVALAASTRRPEGDLVLVGGGAPGVVNLGFLLVGALAGAFAVGRVLATPSHARTEAPAVPSSQVESDLPVEDGDATRHVPAPGGG